MLKQIARRKNSEIFNFKIYSSVLILLILLEPVINKYLNVSVMLIWFISVIIIALYLYKIKELINLLDDD